MFYKQVLIFSSLSFHSSTWILENKRGFQGRPRSPGWTGVYGMVVPHVWIQLCLVITAIISYICISLCCLLTCLVSNFYLIPTPVMWNRRNKHHFKEEETEVQRDQLNCHMAWHKRSGESNSGLLIHTKQCWVMAKWLNFGIRLNWVWFWSPLCLQGYVPGVVDFIFPILLHYLWSGQTNHFYPRKLRRICINYIWS